jgi:hypothetical protein
MNNNLLIDFKKYVIERKPAPESKTEKRPLKKYLSVTLNSFQGLRTR